MKEQNINHEKEIFFNKKVFILVGTIGAGKSTISQKIIDKFGAICLSSDKIRKKLSDNNPEKYPAIYADRYVVTETDAEKEKYNEIKHEAHKLLYEEVAQTIKNGQRVIIDATHLDQRKRAEAVARVEQEGISKNKICFIVIKTKRKKIKKRMKKNLSNEHGASGESIYHGWKRVTKILRNAFTAGYLSYPDKSEGVDIFTGKEVDGFL